MNVRKRIFIYLLLLVAAGAAMILLQRQFLQQDLQYLPRDYNQSMELGELNVVTDYNSIGYFVSGDTALGFQLEMMRELEQEWKVKVNIFLENSLEKSLQGLQAERYDLVARNIPVNSALRDSFSFTVPITYNRLVLIQRKALFDGGEEPIRQHLELAGKEIHVAANSPAILRLDNLSHEIGDTILILEDPLYDTEQLVMMVASGDIDYTVCDKEIAFRLAELFPEIDTDTDIGFTQLEAWAVRSNSPLLLDSLNSWLIGFRNSSRFDQIFRRYYP